MYSKYDHVYESVIRRAVHLYISNDSTRFCIIRALLSIPAALLLESYVCGDNLPRLQHFSNLNQYNSTTST